MKQVRQKKAIVIRYHVCFVIQSCLTLREPMDCSLPGSSVLGDSPGKNTGMGSLSLLQWIFPTQETNRGLLHCRQILYQLSYQGSPEGHSVVSNSVQPHRRPPTRPPHLWDSPGKNTGVGSHSFLQGIFPTQGSNPGLPHCRQVLYQAGVWQNPLY